MFRLIFVFVILFTHNIWAQNKTFQLSSKFVPDITKEFYTAKSDDGYVLPNEKHPEDALEAFQRAPEGVYISVGTERGFLGAAYSPRVTHLVLFDKNPNVTNFNLLNILLLKMANDRRDYLFLRQEANFLELLERMEKREFSQDEIRLVANQHSSLKRYVKDSKFGNYLDNQERHKTFKLNYLEDDMAFTRLKKMADADRIQAFTASSGDDLFLDELIAEFKRLDLKLSVFDYSNAWWSLYTPPERLQRAFNQLSKVSIPNSLYLFTDNGANRSQYHTRWNYNAYTFLKIKDVRWLETKILGNYNFYHQNRIITLFTGKKHFKLYGNAQEKYSCDKHLE
ncbi:MAG: hypothetical protein JNM93_04580 [Bacteriovoracaceae bacterium]|nr:hypothetical protein [Bacteriovoracaceae bacterium]